MYTLLCSIAVAIGSISVTWIVFLAMMALKRSQMAGKLTIYTKVLGYPWLAAFILLDFLFNMTMGSLMFADPPREFLFTSRLNRYLRGVSWRKTLAFGICSVLLDQFDPEGYHCRDRSE